MTKDAPRAKHVGLGRKIHKLVTDELGDVAAGGPPVFVAKPHEWGPGLTKRLENMTDEELGEITGIQLHIAHDATSADPV